MNTIRLRLRYFGIAFLACGPFLGTPLLAQDYPLAAALYLVGFLVALLSRKRQRLGDHAADTVAGRLANIVWRSISATRSRNRFRSASSRGESRGLREYLVQWKSFLAGKPPSISHSANPAYHRMSYVMFCDLLDFRPIPGTGKLSHDSTVLRGNWADSEVQPAFHR